MRAPADWLAPAMIIAAYKFVAGLDEDELQLIIDDGSVQAAAPENLT